MMYTCLVEQHLLQRIIAADVANRVLKRRGIHKKTHRSLDISAYHESLNVHAGMYPHGEGDLSTRSEFLEHAMLDAATAASVCDARSNIRPLSSEDIRISSNSRSLSRSRRFSTALSPLEASSSKKSTCKEIQKLVRRKRRLRK